MMFSPGRTTCLSWLVNSTRPSSSLPDFLVPALCSQRSCQPFSSSSRCASRIGGASLSLPPEVDLRLLEPPAARRKSAITRTELPKTVEVEGPLGEWLVSSVQEMIIDIEAGKMTMQLPPYMALDLDRETRKATLRILDREERKQREMWGNAD